MVVAGIDGSFQLSRVADVYRILHIGIGFVLIVQIFGDLFADVIDGQLIDDSSLPISIVVSTAVIQIVHLGLVDVQFGVGGVTPDNGAAGGGGIVVHRDAYQLHNRAGGGFVHKATVGSAVALSDDVVHGQLSFTGDMQHTAVAVTGVIQELTILNQNGSAIGITGDNAAVLGRVVVLEYRAVDLGIRTRCQIHNSAGSGDGILLKTAGVDLSRRIGGVEETAVHRGVTLSGYLVQNQSGSQSVAGIVGFALRIDGAALGGTLVVVDGSTIDLQRGALDEEGTAVSALVTGKGGVLKESTHLTAQIDGTGIRIGDVVFKGDVLGGQFNGVGLAVVATDIHRTAVADSRVAAEGDVLQGHSHGLCDDGTAVTLGGVVLEQGVLDGENITGIDGTAVVSAVVAGEDHVGFDHVVLRTNVGDGGGGVGHINGAAQIGGGVILNGSVVDV